MTKTLSNEYAYNAMCLWEAMLECRDDLSWLKQAFEAHGTAEIRECCLIVSKGLELLWERTNHTTDLDLGCFDWEFCPAVLNCMTGFDLPTAAQVITHYRFIAGE